MKISRVNPFAPCGLRPEIRIHSWVPGNIGCSQPPMPCYSALISYGKLYNPAARANIKEMHLVRPIPTQMIDRVTNKEAFKQNPGY